jgi:hypothetical protein
MMVIQVPTIIMIIKVKPSNFTHKLKQVKGLFRLTPVMLQVVLSMKSKRAKGVSIKTPK